MSLLTWDNIADKTYEYGVDKGVLYVSGQPGVAWNGLISVAENSDGGDVTSFYVDGVKYLAHSTTETFDATIEAYTYPDEFNVCDGSSSLGNGLIATQQRRVRFGLAYRTWIANAASSTPLGYKIHIVHNALVAPSTRTNSTVKDVVDPLNFSWSITTRADVVRGYKPTSHFIIDSRHVPAPLLATIEGILYGTLSTAPRIPSAGELIYLFTSYLSRIFDAGFIEDPVYHILDAGSISNPVTNTINSGGP
jgi:hypothetical protein